MSTVNDSHVEDTETTTENNSQEAVKTYTQDEVDAMMARTRNSTEHKVSKRFEGVDVDKYRQWEANEERAKQKKQIEKGEFEKTLQELAQKKDAEISKRDEVIKEYKVNTPLLDAAAKLRAHNPAQVRQLLHENVRLNEMGDVEVVDSEGKVRYSDAGTPFTVDELVNEFLDSNPHFVQPTPSTTNSQSNHVVHDAGDFDLSKLDLTKPADREAYAKAKAAGKLS